MSTELFFRAAFWVLVGLTIAMRSWFAIRAKQAGEQLLPDRASIAREGWVLFYLRVAIFILLVALVVLGFVHPFHSRLPVSAGWRWLGLGLSTAALALWFWTHLTLGRLWSAKLRLREDHQLRVSGPYTLVRHPMYTAIVVWAAGLGLLVANRLPLLFAALAAIVFVGRAPREEQMMIEQFGDEYRAYRKSSGRFLPKIVRRP